MAAPKSVLVSWKEGDDDGAVVFTDDGADKAEDKARAFVALDLNRSGVESITISDAKVDDEGRLTTSGKAKAAE